MIRRVSSTLWLALLGAATFALYAWNLGRGPIYLHGAEVLFSLHAHAIATTGHDANGRLLSLSRARGPAVLFDLAALTAEAARAG